MVEDGHTCEGHGHSHGNEHGHESSPPMIVGVDELSSPFNVEDASAESLVHRHGASCGHIAFEHGDHIGFVVDGEMQVRPQCPAPHFWKTVTIMARREIEAISHSICYMILA